MFGGYNPKKLKPRKLLVDLDLEHIGVGLNAHTTSLSLSVQI